MCSGSEAEIMFRPRLPIVAVMAGAEARLAEITYLILLIPSSGKSVDEGIVHTATGFIIQSRNRAGFKHASKGCTVLIHQGISRDMLNIELQSIFNVIAPLRHRLARKAEHQINGYIPDSSLSQSLNSRPNLTTVMTTAKKTQTLIGECLYTHRDTVDATLYKQLCQFLRHIIRITLYRHLRSSEGYKRLKQATEIIV